LKKDLRNIKENPSLADFFFGIAVCHSVTTDNWKNWVCASHDEKALLSFADQLGIKFIDRDFNDGSLNVNIFNNLKKVKLCSHLQFTSERKCMSVLI